MNVKKVVDYWLRSAAEDRIVAEHLLEKADYRYALFLGHLYLEKLLKGMIVRKSGEQAPYSHNLLFLANKTGITLSEDDKVFLDRMTRWAIDARYPDDDDETLTPEQYKQEIFKAFEKGSWLQSTLKS